jgi:heat shock protein HslJ
MSTKARLIAASIAAIRLGAAHGSGAAAPPDPRLAGTTWRAETITGSPVIDFAASTITFETDGPVHGRGGCNRFSGSATLDGERLSLGALGATMRACAPALMDQEARFLPAIQSAERRSFDEHDLLLIYSSGADEPSRFAPFDE